MTDVEIGIVIGLFISLFWDLCFYLVDKFVKRKKND